ncbi:CotH kinase family protein [Crocinitomix catalasitica]|nr:CotH kinase family protein [Crocinitomix catalasitica]
MISSAKIAALVSLAAIFSWGTRSFSQTINPPASNYEAGIFTADISLEIFHSDPEVVTFYTLNGSDPTTADYMYTGPIVMSNRNGDPNSYVNIPTNPSFAYPYGNYTASRADNRGWLAPLNEVYKINVIRFRGFKPGFAPSKIVTQTFMIDPAGAAKYSFPIVSIAVDSTDIFSDEEGYYVYGDTLDPPGNYTWKGLAWEKMAHFEMFETDGTLGHSQYTRSRMHGGGSRHSCRKSFRLYGETDPNLNFKYQFFPETELGRFKRVLIKSGGHRPDCFPRDDLGNLVTDGLDIDQQHFRHVVLFINGEYWGLHSIKERMDRYFFQNEYGIDDNDITILDQEFDVQDGYATDSLEMDMLEDFIIFNDMNIQANMDFVAARIDIENYLDYMCSEIFLSNEDWVYSNVVMWRKTGAYDQSGIPGHDGKFRWATYDLDGAFGGSCSEAYYTVNTLEAATVETGTFASYTRFFRGLLENDNFKRDFINRMCDLTNSWFEHLVMDQHIDGIYTALGTEMMENVDRWRYPSTATTLAARDLEIPSLTKWNYVLDEMHLFAENRCRKIKEHIMLKWAYADTSELTADVNDVFMGRVQVNTILLNDALPGINPGVYPWTGSYMNDLAVPLIAVPLPGYRFVEWMETGVTNDTISWTPTGDTIYTAVFELDPTFQAILINEVMINNDTYYSDLFGDYDDWSELFNPNTYAINLSDCKIVKDLVEYGLPNGTVIQPNSYLLFWHDAETYQGWDHASYKLPNVNDTVFFVSSTGITLDFLEYFGTSNDHSYGRFPNGTGTFIEFDKPTPLMNNDYTEIGEIETMAGELLVHPNPSNGLLKLNRPTSFSIYNLRGERVMSRRNCMEFSLHHLTDGIYVLHSTSGETLKIILKK